MTRRSRRGGFLAGTTVYLSGPMDFVASRASEAKHGWRNRVGRFLRRLGVTVLDPWKKPEIRGFYEYGREGPDTTWARRQWRFDRSSLGARARARCARRFWQTLHVDLRMVDKSDFVIAYCPTNIYSVGTVHEIVVAREQHKPVLFVSPQVRFPSLDALKQHCDEDRTAIRLLARLEAEIPIKANPDGLPSLWYMPLVRTESFFDGFGFEPYRRRFGWKPAAIDEQEAARSLKNPLLPFLEGLGRKAPRRWDGRLKRYIADDDWLLWGDEEAPRQRA